MTSIAGGPAEISEETWLAQLTEMQEALAALQGAGTGDAVEYGNDLDLGDDDLTASDDDDDLFDSYDADGYSSYSSEELEDRSFDLQWLRQKCTEYCLRRSWALSDEELLGKLRSVLESNRRSDDLQSTLADILGYEDLDLVSELILHRNEIVKSSRAVVASVPPGGGEDSLLRLLTREQREEALRQADLEHKSKPLGPKLVEPYMNYPHVYRAHAAGDTLSAFGRRYALPMGSKRDDQKEFEEITIPAAKVGTVQAGEKLVAIPNMDKLCQQTFKGYKSLNRMQSLVYPVAYNTNENMLICAPTGAVSLSVVLSARIDVDGAFCAGKNGCCHAYYSPHNSHKLRAIASSQP